MKKLKTASVMPAVFFLCFYAGCRSWESVPADMFFYMDSAGNISEEIPVQDQGQQCAVFRFHGARYLCRLSDSSPEGKINNRAVDLVLAGDYIPAARLFRELEGTGAEAAAANNLGVLAELYGADGNPADLYGRACRLEPGCSAFLKNRDLMRRNRQVFRP